MDEKERQRKALIVQQQEEIKEMAKMKQEQHEQKIAEVFAKNDEQIELRRLEFEERQLKNEEKRQMFEDTRRQMYPSTLTLF